MKTSDDRYPQTSPQNSPQKLNDDIISFLQRLREKGVKSVYLSEAPASAQGAAVTQTPAETSTTEDTPMPQASTTGRTSLAELEKVVSTCTLCGLHEGRTKTVFGTGDPNASIMFIGEGPGRDEDMQGKPFVGRSGQLLTKMIEAIDLTRDQVYIANIVKCRPPNNRDPQEDEVRCCEQYLKQQIAAIKPKVICALGKVSASWLLQSKDALGAMRDRDNYYEDTRVLVTYHPAALLRNPNFKRGAWDDFKKLRDLAKK